MKRKLRKGISVLLAAAFVISGARLVNLLYDYRAADEVYDAAQELVTMAESQPPLGNTPVPEPLPSPEPAPVQEPEQEPEPASEPLAEEVRYLLSTDLGALRKTNERVLGWICIPDSEIDYPLMAVKDNNEYLRRAWDGSKNNAGCIFLECRNQRDLSDFNTLIYGHYMKNGTMFGSLKYYAEAEYLAAHPFVYIVTDERVRRYQVFSAYEADITSDTYRLYFEDSERRQNVLDYYIGSTEVETGIIPAVEDHILTLSTCTGNGTYDTRWVVQCVLEAEFPRVTE